MSGASGQAKGAQNQTSARPETRYSPSRPQDILSAIPKQHLQFPCVALGPRESH